jgi:hypothetical protein
MVCRAEESLRIARIGADFCDSLYAEEEGSPPFEEMQGARPLQPPTEAPRHLYAASDHNAMQSLPPMRYGFGGA